jgi:rubredoxin
LVIKPELGPLPVNIDDYFIKEYGSRQEAIEAGWFFYENKGYWYCPECAKNLRKAIRWMKE